MYELGYVKKRKRRRVVLIGTSIGAMGVSVLAIVAFLGRFVGTFTVSVDNGDVYLSLCESSTFDKPESLLRIEKLPPYEEWTYKSLPEPNLLDNEDTPYTYGAIVNPATNEITSLNYFKYTFFVKNVGTTIAQYHIKYRITESKPAEDGRRLDDTIRVAIYDHDANSDDHSCTVYAKDAAETNYKADGTPTMQEFIAEYPYNDTEDENHPLAERFKSSEVVTEYSVPMFAPNDMRRITLVVWLEGYDPQSIGQPPIGASLKLGVNINAYEN